VRRLAAYREEVALLLRQHRGRLVDFTGDNFLAEFPSALDAVQAAVEIQRAIAGRNADLLADARMEFRIGAHLGDVRIEDGRLFERTLDLAPDYAPALAMLGQTYLQRYQWCWALDRAQNRSAVELFHRALALDPSLADAHFGLGAAELLEGRPAQGIPHIERAIELAPSLDVHRLALSAAQSDVG
jgi:tetratricopeptide (TPR) repeat protein